MAEPLDLSLRKLPAVMIFLPFRISLSVSSCTMLSSVAIPFGSTQTGRADVELPPVPEAFEGRLLALAILAGLPVAEGLLPIIVAVRLEAANSCSSKLTQ